MPLPDFFIKGERWIKNRGAIAPQFFIIQAVGFPLCMLRTPICLL